MVCDSCKSKLSKLAPAQVWKPEHNENQKPRRTSKMKTLKTSARANPYANLCLICKLRTQQNQAKYCSQCAYSEGICAICGVKVLDTSMYAMREGSSKHHAVRQRSDESFKSKEQLAREQAQSELLSHLESVNSIGIMPTRRALDKVGKSLLAEQLTKAFGGLHAAAEALGLSKRNLIEEAENRLQRKRDAVLQSTIGHSVALEKEMSHSNCSSAATTTIHDQTDYNLSCSTSEIHDQAEDKISSSTSEAPASTSIKTTTAEDRPMIENSCWQYDPNSGYFYNVEYQCYYDSKSRMYFRDGEWHAKAPLESTVS